MRLCLLIPVYNHEGAMAGMLESLQGSGLPCLMVDDGSSEECRQELIRLQAERSAWVSLIRLPGNLGKGGAVMAGLREAGRLGFTHALQIDADGQHDVADLPRFIAAAEAEPSAVICGSPLFDSSAPLGRRLGRLATRVWIWINTLSLEIKDAMCGFRIYPLDAALALMGEARLGERMDFDPEILVRLSWKGLRIVDIPTKVRYPRDGRSHFRLFEDNWRISRLHARLFFGMLFRSPLLLWRKCRPNTGPTWPKSAQPGA
jgi:glycosyltransferase involved in cell wall biosynthesis